MAADPHRLPSLHFVVRSAGERTLPLCQALLHEMVGVSDVTVIEERPFEEAIRRSYQVGIEAGRDWTVTIDADILVEPARFAQFAREAARATADVFVLQPYIFDFITDRFRSAGIKFYRTSLLSTALGCIPEPASYLRPETETVKRMLARGYREQYVPVAVGLHDFGQYHRDIFRKCFVHGQKFRKLAVTSASLLLGKSGRNPEYAVALCGMTAGMQSSELARIDVTAYRRQAEAALQCLNLPEKAPLDTRDSDALRRYVSEMDRHLGPFHGTSVMGNARNRIARHGIADGLKLSLLAWLSRVYVQDV